MHSESTHDRNSLDDHHDHDHDHDHDHGHGHDYYNGAMFAKWHRKHVSWSNFLSIHYDELFQWELPFDHV